MAQMIPGICFERAYMFGQATLVSRLFFCLLLSVSSTCLSGESLGSEDGNAEQPNVIFIFCDDLGWGDFGVLHQNHSNHPRQHKTPQIDRMAAEGVLMRSHYCGAPVCAPSRATLLSGVHQGHTQVRDNQFDKALADNHTIASVLKEAGYRTWMVGKHGLQGKGENPTNWEGYPTQRGFERFYGYVRHGDGHVHYPAEVWPLGNSEAHRSRKEVWHNNMEVSKDLSKCYTTDLFTARGKQWMIDHVRSGDTSPFFLYLAYDTPHAALQIPTGPFPKGMGVEGGLQWIGKPGEMINTARGVIDSYRHPDYVNRGWEDVEERFATMVRRIDNCVGDLLQTLRDLKIDKETIVVISSDNGPLNVSYLPGQPIEATAFQSYGPFEGIKRDVWEGGIRMATVALGPGFLGQGIVDSHPSQSQDWMSTFADFAGVLPPARCDGVSLRPTLTGNPSEQEPSRVYIEYLNGGKTPRYDDFEPRKRGRKRGQMQVVHWKHYKGVRTHLKTGKEPFEIYDLEQDPKERNNLYSVDGEFEKIQTQMQATAMRGRRPNASAPRPYDQLPVPALKPFEIESYQKSRGLSFKWMGGDFSYTPDLRGITTQHQQVSDWSQFFAEATTLGTGAIEGLGYWFAPKTGFYSFRVRGLDRGFVRIHDSAILDMDFPESIEQDKIGSIHLEEGWHPLRLTARVQDLSKELIIEWKHAGERDFSPISDEQWSVFIQD